MYKIVLNGLVYNSVSSVVEVNFRLFWNKSKVCNMRGIGLVLELWIQIVRNANQK